MTVPLLSALPSDYESLLLILLGVWAAGITVVGSFERLKPYEGQAAGWVLGPALAAGVLWFLTLAATGDRITPAALGEKFGDGFVVTLVVGTALVATVPYGMLLYFYPGAYVRGRLRGRREAAERRRRDGESLAVARREREAYERAAPERERDRLRAEAEGRESARAQFRREDARAACELLYGLHAPDIGGRFPKPALDDFMKKYMDDDRTAEHVEQRSLQLQGIIRQHLERVRPSPKFTTVEEVALWFREQKRAIEALDVEERVKKVHLAELSERYAEATSRLMEGAAS